MAPGLPGAIFARLGDKWQGTGHNNRKDSIANCPVVLWGSLEKSSVVGRIYPFDVKYPYIISGFVFLKALGRKEVPAQYPVAAGTQRHYLGSDGDERKQGDFFPVLQR
jgi:hypothetical protein